MLVSSAKTVSPWNELSAQFVGRAGDGRRRPSVFKAPGAGGDARVSRLTPCRVGACRHSADGVAAVATEGSPLRATSVKDRTRQGGFLRSR